MAEVLPFPIVRRRAYVTKQAAHAACMNPDAGERYIQYQLKIQGDSLRRKGVPEPMIEREISGLETAIRGSMQRLLIDGGAA
jgi:uncharacterized protein DUF6074